MHCARVAHAFIGASCLGDQRDLYQAETENPSNERDRHDVLTAPGPLRLPHKHNRARPRRLLDHTAVSLGRCQRPFSPCAVAGWCWGGRGEVEFGTWGCISSSFGELRLTDLSHCCLSCFASPATYTSSRCGEARYCRKERQLRDWKGHKEECKSAEKREQERAAAEAERAKNDELGKHLLNAACSAL